MEYAKKDFKEIDQLAINKVVNGDGPRETRKKINTVYVGTVSLMYKLESGENTLHSQAIRKMKDQARKGPF